MAVAEDGADSEGSDEGGEDGGEGSDEEAGASRASRGGRDGVMGAEDDDDNGGGEGGEEGEEEDEEEEDDDKDVEFQSHAFTPLGLVRRMARLADDGRYARQHKRMAALRWIAAVASTLKGRNRGVEGGGSSWQ